MELVNTGSDNDLLPGGNSYGHKNPQHIAWTHTDSLSIEPQERKSRGHT